MGKAFGKHKEDYFRLVKELEAIAVRTWGIEQEEYYTAYHYDLYVCVGNIDRLCRWFWWCLQIKQYLFCQLKHRTITLMRVNSTYRVGWTV